MKRVWIITAAGVVAVLLAFFAFLVHVLLASGDPQYWEEEIAAFERRDISNPPEPGRVLFVGGTDIRKWETLSVDMHPVRALARGFGGAQIPHVTHYIQRIVVPYKPRAIVIAAGEADLSDVRGRRPEDVRDDLRKFIEALQASGIDVPVYFVSIHASPLRAARAYGVRRANELIRELQKNLPQLRYIDVASAMLDQRGKLREDLFRWDGLSLSDAGYALLRDLIKPVLIADGFGAPER